MPPNVRLIVGRRIRELRQKKGWSQEQLAEHADLDRTYVGRVERGEKNIGIEELLRLSVALGVSVTAVLAMTMDSAQVAGRSDARENAMGLVDEYRMLFGSRNCRERESLEKMLVSGADWTPQAAQHLARLAREYGAFMLRNALAVSVALRIEDGELGF